LDDREFRRTGAPPPGIRAGWDVPLHIKDAIVPAIMAAFDAETTGPGMMVSIANVMIAADMADIKRAIAEMNAAERAELRKFDRVGRAAQRSGRATCALPHR
jgi:hypothetical protein